MVGFLRKGEEFTVVEERASSDGTLLRIEGNKGWAFSASRSGTFCQRVVVQKVACWPMFPMRIHSAGKYLNSAAFAADKNGSNFPNFK